MSRWAEMFAALSEGHDTVDSVDAVAEATGATPTVSQSVHCVRAPERVEGHDPEQLNPRSLTVDEQPLIERVGINEEGAEGLLSSPGSADDLDEHAVIAEGAGVPTRWAEGFAVLSAMPPPTGFSLARWRRIINAAGIFIDKWAAKAAECGWSDLDVFGVNPDAPGRRFDAMGLVLLLDHCEVVAVDERGADLVANGGARLRYRRRPVPADTVSLWALTSGGPGAAA